MIIKAKGIILLSIILEENSVESKQKFFLIIISLVLAVSILACGSATPSATNTPKPPPSMVGRWQDPDTTGTYTTIEAQGDGFAVVSVINEARGINELTDSSWADGVLTWTYCPEDMYCISSKTISVSETTLTADWWWTDGGNGGTTKFTRVP
jgi:hypothetical protein